MFASLGVMAVFAVAFLIMSPKSPVSPFRPAQTADGDAELYTGTIQLAPSRSNLCRRMVFDNRTGEMHDKGLADCDRLAAAASSAEPERYWRNNIDKVREGFVHR